MARESRECFAFVSYSRHDELIVTPVVRLIQAVGATACQSTDSIEPEEEWRRLTLTDSMKAALVIVFWSKNSANSEAVRKEWMHGLRSDKTIIPVLLDSTPLEPDKKPLF